MKSGVQDIDRLHFPAEIAEVIGLCVNEIAFLKKKGCPFHGRKTTVRWVRNFIANLAGAEAQRVPSTSGHLRRSGAYKCDEQDGSND